MKKIIFAAIAAFMLVGCGIGEDIEKAGERYNKNLPNLEKRIQKLEKEFDNSQLSSSLNIYVQSEKLKEQFKKAKEELKKAKKTNKSLQALIKKDEEDSRASALAKMRVIDYSMRNSSSLASSPMKRLQELKKALDNSKKITNESEETFSYILKKSNDIVSFIEEQLISNENTSNKKDDLNKEIKVAKNKAKKTEELLKVVQSENKKENEMNISLFLKSSKEIKELKKEIDIQNKRVHKKIQEVNTSYTKILSDMREDFYIQVGVTSWDDYYDGPTEHTRKLTPSKVTKSIYERLGNNNGTIATYGKGIFSGLKLNIPSSDWNALRIKKEQLLARGDDTSEVWIADTPIKYFHKYIIVKNGVKKETDWIEVDERIYEENYDNLNMSIITKPYGFYETDTIKDATPAGMAFVGNKKYGEWREDTNTSSPHHGHSFWHYYGIYSFLSGGNNHHYYHSDYDHYRRYRNSNRHTGYYGRNHSYGTFGTRGIKRIRPSSMRSRIRTSRSSRVSRGSVRSTGRGSRGRGPGGGGK